MEFALAIHKDPDSCYGVTVPNVPGVFSAGDTIDEAIHNAREAIFFHIESIIEDGGEVEITSRSIEELIVDPDFATAIWAYVEVDLSKLDSRPERINISLPRFVLRKIDSYVEARHETRSGFLARVALEAIANG
ncbi:MULTISPECIES: type II toxin-antitoxin system HicB family antitoxin [Caballeronia]|jgi:predicted RNase H-like HicB family nuclease|uniref:type II toxin-antitoxin system HicB family antitoxin n=1 Tax=Caballeronia TaxID=1827195 RepID=UPI00158CDD72|nr:MULTISPECIES: type II toxin-antitoxin system HicB family antitoxin [Caballeronia]MCG7402604.1 type II toxin-antitoxin system HicB family antitoxin [Caballeronia zhejiangensis]MCI1044271.1 type II toxin-antitoxin system HicB family antitoxin [Caballeronia zhejiangensis]MDR5792483.1 type II toxin-antitoxin system HicB family antitoxin [Caballeronia sp. LZ008]